MARPAPLTTLPMSPSSLMNVRFASRAATPPPARRPCHAAPRCPAAEQLVVVDVELRVQRLDLAGGVVTSGLISASEAPLAMNAAYSCCMIFAAARCCFTSSYSAVASEYAWNGSSP
jgi:hypothetical protein